MAQRNNRERTKNKENQREEGDEGYTDFDRENPAWQSNSKIGSRARVFNNTAKYTWKYGNETGGLEKNDLRKERVKGQMGNFNETRPPYQKNRIKSVVAITGALERNDWVIFVKAAQTAWNNVKAEKITYPCVIGDPIIQLMYHSKDTNSQTNARVVNRLPAIYYPRITHEFMVQKYAEQNPPINYDQYINISPDDFVNQRKVNIFDTIDGFSAIRNEIANLPLPPPNMVVNPINNRMNNENDENGGFQDLGFDTTDNQEVQGAREEKNAENLQSFQITESRIFDYFLDIDSLPDAEDNRLMVNHAIETNQQFTYIINFQDEYQFAREELLTLYNPAESIHANNRTLISKFIMNPLIQIAQALIDKTKLSVVVFTPDEYHQIFKEKDYTSELAQNLIDTNGWILIVQTHKNRQYCMVTVTKKNFTYDMIVSRALLQNNNSDIEYDRIAQDINDFFHSNQQPLFKSTNVSYEFMENKLFMEREWPRIDSGAQSSLYTLLFMFAQVQLLVDQQREIIPFIKKFTQKSGKQLFNLRFQIAQFLIQSSLDPDYNPPQPNQPTTPIFNRPSPQTKTIQPVQRQPRSTTRNQGSRQNAPATQPVQRQLRSTTRNQESRQNAPATENGTMRSTRPRRNTKAPSRFDDMIPSKRVRIK